MRVDSERLAPSQGAAFRQTVLLTDGMESRCALIKNYTSRSADVTAENEERSDTMIGGVTQMLQTMTPPYVQYLRREQPWPETVVLWPFGKEWR